MKIDVNIFSDINLLNAKVNSSVVNSIIKCGKSNVKTIDILQRAYKDVGITEQLFATKKEMEAMHEAVKKCLNLLQSHNAVMPNFSGKNAVLNYFEHKCPFVNKLPSIKGVSEELEVSTDFVNIVSTIKADEVIVRSNVIVFDFEGNHVRVANVKNIDIDRVNTCNDKYDYTKIANYLGVYNQQTDRVDLVSTKYTSKRFFNTPFSRVISPEKKELLDLYKWINDEHKNLFKTHVVAKPVKVPHGKLVGSVKLSTNSQSGGVSKQSTKASDDVIHNNIMALPEMISIRG